eukprot:CAMPEP_0179493804 /NCGR_PEP_ID=MMETSP0799-20121207/67719_2 /TAXON_ID=46947 /ORGANISM="Geminigera cryophila, Strain CCMP2564" /LENGTH=80 /DNA_ID=CAMNT_0021311151 /DNA_START=641 /DNA_END=880 /DNA_ORIENTATION=-
MDAQHCGATETTSCILGGGVSVSFTLSADVIHPLHARQSVSVILAGASFTFPPSPPSSEYEPSSSSWIVMAPPLPLPAAG